MNRLTVISLLAVVASFVGGFLLANALNRSELESLRSENVRLIASGDNSAQTDTLSNDEIRAKIAEADRNADNFEYQKSLGLALYRYGSMKKDPELIREAVRLLERAGGIKKSDYQVTVGTGNAYFDIGYFGKDNSAFEHARTFYDEALKAQPSDVDVQTDVGLTFFLQNPPDYDRSIEAFRASLRTNPKHEKTLQYLVQALARQNKFKDAEDALQQLRTANPTNEAIDDLAAQLANSKGEPN